MKKLLFLAILLPSLAAAQVGSPLPSTAYTRRLLRSTTQSNAWTVLGIIGTNQTEVTNWITVPAAGSVVPGSINQGATPWNFNASLTAPFFTGDGSALVNLPSSTNAAHADIADWALSSSNAVSAGTASSATRATAAAGAEALIDPTFATTVAQVSSVGTNVVLFTNTYAVHGVFVGDGTGLTNVPGTGGMATNVNITGSNGIVVVSNSGPAFVISAEPLPTGLTNYTDAGGNMVLSNQNSPYSYSYLSTNMTGVAFDGTGYRTNVAGGSIALSGNIRSAQNIVTSGYKWWDTTNEFSVFSPGWHDSSPILYVGEETPRPWYAMGIGLVRLGTSQLTNCGYLNATYPPRFAIGFANEASPTSGTDWEQNTRRAWQIHDKDWGYLTSTNDAEGNIAGEVEMRILETDALTWWHWGAQEDKPLTSPPDHCFLGPVTNIFGTRNTTIQGTNELALNTTNLIVQAPISPLLHLSPSELRVLGDDFLFESGIAVSFGSGGVPAWYFSLAQGYTWSYGGFRVGDSLTNMTTIVDDMGDVYARNLTVSQILSVGGGIITNGTTIWASVATNDVPTVDLPNGSICTTTNGSFYVRSNGVWVLH